MDEPEARDIRNQFFAAFPQLRPWQSAHCRLCQDRGYVAMDGRIVAADWEPGKELRFTQCCNLPIQAAAANVTLRALKLIHKALTAARIRGGLAACVHDEFVCEVHVDDAEAARALIVDAMTLAFQQTFPDAPTRNLVAIGIAENWKDAKP